MKGLTVMVADLVIMKEKRQLSPKRYSQGPRPQEMGEEGDYAALSPPE